MTTIELDHLHKHFGTGALVVRALDDVSLTVEGGELLAVVGRSGSGRATLLDCAGVLLRPTAGRVLPDGVDTATLRDGRRADLRARRIGFIFQAFHLLPTLSAMENVLLPLRYSVGDRRAARVRAEALLEEVGLAGRAHHRPSELSGGSSSESPSPGPSSTSPACSSVTSPWARLTPRPPRPSSSACAASTGSGG